MIMTGIAYSCRASQLAGAVFSIITIMYGWGAFFFFISRRLLKKDVKKQQLANGAVVSQNTHLS